MLYLITGDNSYRMRQEIKKITGASSDNAAISGESLSYGTLIDMIAGASLFASNETVIIRELSSNSELWQAVDAWIGRIDKGTNVILLERSVDKRTKAYKTLKKYATLIECPHWSERQHSEAGAWLDKVSHRAKIVISRPLIEVMIRRATHTDESGRTYIDQSELHNAVSALKGSTAVDAEMIDTVMPPDVQENVFDLLTCALETRRQPLATMIAHLRATEEPYRLLALLITQWYQLGLLISTDATPSAIASESGVSPYPLQKLASHRRRFSRRAYAHLTGLLAQLDTDIKTSSTDPWYAIERFLIAVSNE